MLDRRSCTFFDDFLITCMGRDHDSQCCFCASVRRAAASLSNLSHHAGTLLQRRIIQPCPQPPTLRGSFERPTTSAWPYERSVFLSPSS